MAVTIEKLDAAVLECERFFETGERSQGYTENVSKLEQQQQGNRGRKKGKHGFNKVTG